jgi:hypothetical protein
MSATLTLVTQLHATVRQRSQPTPLRLSPLLRHVLRTATPRADGRPNLLPDRIPSSCCGDLWRCRAMVVWRIGDDKNSVFFCLDHGEALWEAGHDVIDYVVERWRA